MKLPLDRYAPVVIWSGIIFALSSFPSTPAPETWWNFLLKKGAHVIEYAILYWLTFKATSDKPSSRAQVFDSEVAQTRGAEGRQATGKFVKPLVFTILYAITDEIHQSFVPGRHGRWYDVGFDTLGALLVFQMLRRRRLRNSS